MSEGIVGAGQIGTDGCGAIVVAGIVVTAVVCGAAVHVTDTALLAAWMLPPPPCSIFAV